VTWFRPLLWIEIARRKKALFGRSAATKQEPQRIYRNAWPAKKRNHPNVREYAGDHSTATHSATPDLLGNSDEEKDYAFLHDLIALVRSYDRRRCLRFNMEPTFTSQSQNG